MKNLYSCRRYSRTGDKVQGHVTIDSEDQVAHIKFPSELSPGSGVLQLSFKGELNDQMKGFYRCKYKTPSGEERFSASTQFESTFARRAFPCWDEPAIKAKFQVTMIAPKNLTVLSNTNIVSETVCKDDPSLKVVQFGPTPIMSTYLVAFIVGEYEYIEKKTERGISVKIYTPLGKKEQGEFALDTAAKCLTLFEDYFKIPYPLEKLDHIAIPDFASGAMENWGLVTYREVSILVDPEKSSPKNREWCGIAICHETAHQWFGNLVTMEWWTHLWLNEGFASFMEYLSLDKIHPEFKIWSQFVSSASMRAFSLDSLHDTHSIEIPVGHPGEVDSIFDAVSYDKGASIIRMCHDWIGDESFKRGLHEYLTKHAYKNAVTEDLWRSLEEASKKPIEKMMSTWTLQRGHPIVYASMKTDGTKRILTLTQERFTIDGILDDEEKQMLWQIPIALITSQNPKKPTTPTLMTTKSIEIPLDNLAPTGWVKINPEVSGFYRVGYSSEMLELLKPAIHDKQIGSLDRFQIINDLFASSLAGKTSTVDFLKLLSYFDQEDDYVAWSAIDASLSKLDLLLSYTDFQGLLHKFGRELFTKVFARLGFDSRPGETHTNNLLRTLVLIKLIDFGEENVINEAKKRFADHCNGKVMASDVREVVYSAIAKFGSDNDYDMLFKLHDEEDLQEEKSRLEQSIASACEPCRIKRALEFSFSEKVRSQDAWSMIISCASSKIGRELAWNFYCENIGEIQHRYGCHYSSAKLIEFIPSGFGSDERYGEVRNFYTAHPFPGLESCVLRTLERIKNNTEWLARETQPVKQFLQCL